MPCCSISFWKGGTRLERSTLIRQVKPYHHRHLHHHDHGKQQHQHNVGIQYLHWTRGPVMCGWWESRESSWSWPSSRPWKWSTSAPPSSTAHICNRWFCEQIWPRTKFSNWKVKKWLCTQCKIFHTVLSRDNFCRKFRHFKCKFSWPHIAFVLENDKYEVCPLHHHYLVIMHKRSGYVRLVGRPGIDRKVRSADTWAA